MLRHCFFNIVWIQFLQIQKITEPVNGHLTLKNVLINALR